LKPAKSTWIAVALFILWLVLMWLPGRFLGLRPPFLYYLTGGLWGIGLIGLVGYLLLRPKSNAQAGQPADADALSEIDFNFGEAARQLQAGTGNGKLSTLPAVFLIGDAGSAKTSIVAKSGLEAQLLAGRAYQDHLVAPTKSLNIWYARKTLFLDPGGSLLEDPAGRKKIFKRFLPTRWKAVAGAKLPPSRTVVLTVDCGLFLRAGGAEALAAKARSYQALFSDLSRELGSSFPVYVLFTKADQIAYFREFVENFTEGEASEIFGATLPVKPKDQQQGSYGEQQTQRITRAFQDLYYSLCDKRPAYLAREHDAAKLPNVYEFPREFSKLRGLLVAFLVDLCRPSQIGTSPFLRGFYFTGIRPVTIPDLAPAAQVQAVSEEPLDAGATRIFGSKGRGMAALAPEVPEGRARKIPQWVFLGHLFNDVILADRPATTVTQRNVKLNFTRRLLLAAVAVLALCFCGWFTVSYVNNNRLVQDAIAAARAVPSGGLASGQLASYDSLQRLTRVKDTLAVLRRYDTEGVPMGYRLLYAGDDIRQPLRTTYYALFRKLLLAPTQDTLTAICTKPDAYSGQGYKYVYDALKAYLITTSFHEKSMPDFLVPVLMLHWQNDQQVDNERQKLARENFEFYAQDLATYNPYPQFSKPDSGAVETARAYLKRFAQEDTIYETALAQAGQGQRSIVFNRDYPGSSEVVINRYEVNPAFRKSGYTAFQNLLKDPDKLFSGEEWVLGPNFFQAFDKAKLVKDLAARYQSDFVKTWRDYLRHTSLAPYGSVPDAAAKLGKMTGPQSPLLQVLCVASNNTAVPNKDISQIFQPVQSVEPPGCSDHLAAPANKDYVDALLHLQTALQTVGPIANADPNNVAQANTQQAQAEVAVGQLARNFTIDQGDTKTGVDSRTVAILREPITGVPALLKGAGAGPINAAAGGACAAITPMLRKYPFNPRSSTDATLEEVNQFLKPGDGELAKLLNGPLKQYVTRAGDQYIAATGQTLSVTPAFLNFINRASRMSEALYKGGGQAPNFTFTMQALPSPDVSHIALTIDGTTMNTDLKGAAVSQTFPWPGASPGVNFAVSFGGPALSNPPITGLWAAWHFVDQARRWEGPGGQLNLEWTQKNESGVSMINGHPASVRFALDPQSSQIFRPQYFSNLACVSKAVQ
jgi:type VI secretion system protein ImpL